MDKGKDGFVESGLNKKKDGDVRKKRILGAHFLFSNPKRTKFCKRWKGSWLQGKLAPFCWVLIRSQDTKVHVLKFSRFSGVCKVGRVSEDLLAQTRSSSGCAVFGSDLIFGIRVRIRWLE